MPDILSSDELNDLLAAVDDNEADGDLKGFPGNKSVSLYDFRRPTRLSRAQVRQLQKLYESALEGLTSTLSSKLHTQMEANVLGVKALNYGSFASLLPTPTYVNVFRVEQSGSRGLLAIDVPFCLALVDRLLGGHGHAVEKPRLLTAIEFAVLDWPVRLMLQELEQCWSRVNPVHFESEMTRMDLSFAQVMHATETILRVTFAMGGEMGSGEAHLCVPFTVVERTLHKLGQGAQETVARSEADKANARESLKRTDVSLAAELGHATLTIREVLGLRPGQIVKLNTKADKPIGVTVGGRTKFLATPGMRSRALAVQIKRVCAD